MRRSLRVGVATCRTANPGIYAGMPRPSLTLARPSRSPTVARWHKGADCCVAEAAARSVVLRRRFVSGPMGSLVSTSALRSKEKSTGVADEGRSPSSLDDAGASNATTAASTTSANPPPTGLAGIKAGTWPVILSRERCTAPLEFNRFAPVPASFLLQVSIGSVYAWSMWNEPLTRQLGVVVSSAGDWGMGSVVPVFSAAAISLGFCTWSLGSWADRVGPRMVGFAAAAAYGSGCALAGLGCATHSLPLVYIGYGLLGGCGWGLGYISPVSALMKWFPDRRGFATGLALTAFGAGAAVAAPLIRGLTEHFARPPVYLGSSQAVEIVVKDGVQFAADAAGDLREVVVATAADVAKVSPDLAEGVYVVGTGDTGAAGAFAVLGATYFLTMSLGAFGNRLPHPNWRPKGWNEPTTPEATTGDMVKGASTGTPAAAAVAEERSVDHNQVLKMPDFYLLWGLICGNAIAGTAVLSCAKSIMVDVWGTILPAVATGAFATKYISLMSAANASGRLGWAAASDYLGRKNTYYVFGLGIPVCLAIPHLIGWASLNPSTLPLYGFMAGTLLNMSFYGANMAVLPAKIADLFGQKHSGGIHGRVLTAWSAAAVVGPGGLATLRNHSKEGYIRELTEKCDPEAFERTFGAGVDQLDRLVETNTVTIARLMEIAPSGTVDPSPFIYDTTMYATACMLGVAVFCNWNIGRHGGRR